MDDYVASFDTEDEAVKMTQDVVNIHQSGGFVLRNFVSNSSSLLDRLGVSSESRQEINMELDAKATEKILGMRWCTGNDNFVFAMQFDRADRDVITGARRPTKRQLLSIAMSVFDPFGYLANFMLHTKTMIQILWRLGVAWDELIPESMFRQWQLWCSETSRVKQFRMPRCYSVNLMTAINIQLHLFADSSEEAFAAVAYWRIESYDTTEVTFVAGKVKCTPLKILSVPRLELQAAVLATRLYNSIRDCHPDVNIARTIL